VLNTMREDLTDLRSRVDGGLSEMRDGFTEMHGKLDAAAGQQAPWFVLRLPAR
jgi:hypothetical protein